MTSLAHEPLTRLIAQIVAVIICSRLLGVIARRQNQPLVIAEITAGILLGPSLLQAAFPAAYELLFPASSMNVLGLVSQLGLILFMFIIGLELDFDLLHGRGRSAVIISHSSIVLPFILGAGLAVYLHKNLAEPGVEFTPFALFLGTAMSITAFPVLARILSERRLLHTNIGAIAIACAAVDDVTAWCILAFVVAASRAQGFMGAMQTTLFAAVYIALMMMAVRPLLDRLSSRVSDRSGLSQNIVALVLVLLFASSLATEMIGIHALFGAFVLGATIPKAGGLAKALADKLEDVVLTLLLPLFFAYSGIRTQIGLLDTAYEWGLCALIIFVACLGKFGGGMLASRLCGFTWRESSAIGVLMNTRGLMELIVLNIGLDLGVISPTLFTMMVLMALVTTFMTTPVLQRLYPLAVTMGEQAKVEPDTASGQALPVITAPPVAVAPAPAIVALQAPVMVCVAQAQSGPGLVTLAASLRSASGATIYAMHLLPPSDRASFILQSGVDPETDPLAPALATAHSLAVPISPISFVSSDAAKDICEVAEIKRAGLLLLGWHKPLMGQVILGGAVFKVMQRAHCDVGVFVDRGLERIRRVLVPFSGSVHDRAALRLARRMMKYCGASVTILHVHQPDHSPHSRPELDAAPPREKFAEVTADVFAADGDERVEMRILPSGDPIAEAVTESRRGYDLVIAGVGREWGLEQRSFGLQPERIIEQSPISFLIVRGRTGVDSSQED